MKNDTRLHDKYLEYIESLNLDYLRLTNTESKEYKLGYQIILLKKSFPLHTIKLVRNHLKWKKIDKAVESLNISKPKSYIYAKGSFISGSKGVVYACITGTYDKLYDPMVKVDDLDYVVFSDREKNSNIWKYRKIELIDSIFDNATNRYYKFHPHVLFPSNDYSIYIDGNVQVISDISYLYSVAKESTTGIAMHLHTERDSIYAEAQACILHSRGNKENINKQIKYYREQGMPDHFGLPEATIIVVDLKNEIARNLLGKWWQEYNKWESGRDQLAFPYVLWSSGYSLEDIGILGNNKFYNPKFRIHNHAEWRK